MKKDNIRLQKYLAERGIASRRQAAEIISGGQIKVNGTVVTEPGLRIDPSKDKVMFKSKIIDPEREVLCTIILNKPRGYVCSTSGQNSRTIYELIPTIAERVVPVGRLDKNSEGLLLMSNDGELVNQLTHPRFEQKKIYRATVSGEVNSVVIKKLQSRMLIDGYRIQPAKVKLLRGTEDPNRNILEFTLKEGRKRQIRHMCSNAELKVHRLVRISVGDVSLSGLKPGEWRYLAESELKQVKKASSKEL